MYIDAIRPFTHVEIPQDIENAFQNNVHMRKGRVLFLEHPVVSNSSLFTSTQDVPRPGSISDDIIQLNCNNNSSVWDNGYVETTSSRSFSLTSQISPDNKGRILCREKRTELGSLKKRWTTTNRPRNARSKRDGRSHRYSGGSRPKLDTTQSQSAGTESYSLRQLHVYLPDSALPEGAEYNQHGSSDSIHPSQPTLWKCRPLEDVEVSHVARHPDDVQVVLQHMLQQVSCYQCMADIPDSLKLDLANAICKPIIGTNKIYEGGPPQQVDLSHPIRSLESGNNGNRAFTRLHTDGFSERWSEDLYSGDRETTLGVVSENSRGNARPFSTEYVFYQLYGPSYRRAYTYWHVRPPLLPATVFKYKTTADGTPFVIGAGTFGEVSVAWLEINGQKKQVAMKEPFSDLVKKDKVFEEAKVTMYLEPTGYVPLCYGLVLDVRGNYSIVLELFGSGATVKDILSNRTITRLQWLSIARQLAEGLYRIHDMDILVNDIKPDNVLVDLSVSEPVIKYCDMGCASYRSGITFDDVNLDIFSHLAPEVKAGNVTSKASDVYGLGKMLDRLVQVAVISGIVPISEKCMFPEKLERCTAGETLSMLHSLIAAEMKCFVQGRPDIGRSESIGSKWDSEGYDPDSGLSSDTSWDASHICFHVDSSSSDVTQSRPTVSRLVLLTDCVDQLHSAFTFDRMFMSLFLFISVVFVLFKTPERVV